MKNLHQEQPADNQKTQFDAESVEKLVERVEGLQSETHDFKEGDAITFNGNPYEVQKIFVVGGRARLQVFGGGTCWASEAAPRKRNESMAELPWKSVLPAGSNGFYYVVGAKGESVASCYDSDRARLNSEFIARAANSHADLVAALEDCGRIFTSLGEAGQFFDNEERTMSIDGKIERALAAARKGT